MAVCCVLVMALLVEAASVLRVVGVESEFDQLGAFHWVVVCDGGYTDVADDTDRIASEYGCSERSVSWALVDAGLFPVFLVGFTFMFWAAGR
jgi:hypothetical protein